MQPDEQRYTYETAGFNGFMMRSLKSSVGVNNVRAGVSMGSREIAFDRNQTEGMIGDSFAAGSVNINGRAGNITFSDEENLRAIIGFEDEGI